MSPPEVLRRVWASWKRVAHGIARVQTTILITLFYLVIIVPVGLLFNLFGWDPLDRRARNRQRSTNWKPVRASEPDLDSMRRQS